MSRVSRIIWFHDQLNREQYPSLVDLCSNFNISSRQAKRDLHYMRAILGAPIIYSREKKGYKYGEAFTIPLLFSVEKMGNASTRALEYNEFLNTLKRAMEKKRIVRIKDENNTYYIHPYRLDYKSESVLGYSEDEDRIVRISLDSVDSVSISNRRFSKNPSSSFEEMGESVSEKKARVIINGITSELIYFDSVELVCWLLKEDGVQLIGPDEAIKDILDALKTLKTTLSGL